MSRSRETFKDDRLEAAASDVCAAYDILGRLIEADWFERLSIRGYSEFFQHCDYGISMTHDALPAFLSESRKNNTDRYSVLSRLAKATEPLEFERIVNEDGEPGTGILKQSRIVRDLPPA
jgi:hypothetical protein